LGACTQFLVHRNFCQEFFLPFPLQRKWNGTAGGRIRRNKNLAMEIKMAAITQPQEQVSAIFLIEQWERASQKVVDLAAEFPDDAFNSHPVAKLRTCADVLRHLAFWNRYVGGSLRGEKVDDQQNELSAKDYPNKATVLKSLAESSKDVVKALRKNTDAKALELVVTFLQHTAEHYGQLAIYARLKGIVPPASR